MQFFKKHPWVAVAGVQIALLWLLAGRLRFEADGRSVCAVADDIYISACYAQSLADGNGLVWYAGAPRVEGFSNPLWVLVLAGVHALPCFDRFQLGFFVWLLNSGIVIWFWAIAWRVIALGGSEEPEPSRRANWPLIVLAVTGISMAYWLAEGYCLALVCLFAVTALRLALVRPLQVGHTVLIGLLMGLAFWTRMDGVLPFVGVLLVVALGVERRRFWIHAAAGGALFLAMAAALFAARWAYYGDWLPNTYYLKLTGWPLASRLAAGLRQNWILVPCVVAVWLPFLRSGFRTRLGGSLPVYLAGATAFTLTVCYSTYNGGDAWGRMLGFDRYTAIGHAMLLVSLVAAAARLASRRAWWLAMAVSLAPACCGAVQGYRELLLSLMPESVVPRRIRLEQSWVLSGLAIREASLPGARAAVETAGAPIYFSDRGGVDRLGKCEPLIARLKTVDLTSFSGHNKRDDLLLFRETRPELSLFPPPPEVRDRYVRMQLKPPAGETLRDPPMNYPDWLISLAAKLGRKLERPPQPLPRPIWVLRETPLARWDRLAPLPRTELSEFTAGADSGE